MTRQQTSPAINVGTTNGQGSLVPQPTLQGAVGAANGSNSGSKRNQRLQNGNHNSSSATASITSQLTDEQKMEIREAFELFDTDKDGIVNYHQLKVKAVYCKWTSHPTRIHRLVLFWFNADSIAVSATHLSVRYAGTWIQRKESRCGKAPTAIRQRTRTAHDVRQLF
jgi:hypothetical protein